MMLFPKNKRIRDRKHLDRLRELPCVVCKNLYYMWEMKSDPAHIRLNSNSGVRIKPSDSVAIPLCHGHHQMQHQVGEKTFWGDNLDKAITLAKSLYEISGDRQEAIKLIREANL